MAVFCIVIGVQQQVFQFLRLVVGESKAFEDGSISRATLSRCSGVKDIPFSDTRGRKASTTALTQKPVPTEFGKPTADQPSLKFGDPIGKTLLSSVH